MVLVSVILAGIVANVLFRTPNVVGGGEAKMFVIIVLMVLFKITIEFFLTRRSTGWARSVMAVLKLKNSG